MTAADNAHIVKELARGLGFDGVGVAPAEPIAHVQYLRDWVASDRPGSMDYLRRNTHLRENPAEIMEGARSVIVTAMNYHQSAHRSKSNQPVGRVAMYAWGDDYHTIVKSRLRRLVEAMREHISEAFDSRCCVDTVPIVEREIAARAGIGWIGKNTLVLNRNGGSYFFLGEIVTTLELTTDEPSENHCGNCTRCLEACPTGAFPAAYEMDASKCISYLTIEHRDEIDRSLHTPIGDWIFGCDICQEVCPFNRDSTDSNVFKTGLPRSSLPLKDVVRWNESEYEITLSGSAMCRATLPMLQRNARIATANIQSNSSRGTDASA